ncbi:hypothetical protein QBC45DRAFT_242345 [Copromyces sp. CBS 386.78]|nr:hypothetical protein QBC45DRAFT_242345 [Copromyces sp. CBS 386.78]
MDPASAIGVASSAIAFLEFGAKLISATKAIYDSKEGILPEHAAIKQHYQDLLASSSSLDTKTSGKALSPEDIYFQKLSSNFRHDCQAVIHLLNAHRCNEGKRRRRMLGSVKAAFKLPGVKEQLRDIEERLDKTQKAMQLHVFQQLRQEISGVNVTVVAIQGHGNTLQMRPRDMTAVDNEKDPSSLSIQDLKALMDQLSGMVGTLEHLRVESILASLNYETRKVRHDTIKDAHMKTFEWAFDSNFHLSKWLQSGDGIFWVSGWPGSGKSTLMKFLADHTQTKSFLKEWAGENELVVASHYFWCSGPSMQKSWDGLLRSLIFDIFRSHPLSIQQACPGRWERAGAPGAASTPWTGAELATALHAVADLQSSSSPRFCFFIDGLDEYDGDHLELCDIFTNLIRAGTIKMCLSSRPWPVFEDGLGKDISRKLYVHNLTHGDIKTYVAAQLECHPKWKTNNLTEMERTDVVEAVTNKAAGVFLWAYLVTKSLREGLSNYDTGVDLKKRLDQLPSDLKKLFRQILESVNPIYQSKMACFLQAALTATAGMRQLDTTICCNMERELDEPGYALQCSIVRTSTTSKNHDTLDEWLHIEGTSKHISPELRAHFINRYAQVKLVINSRTKGILETGPSPRCAFSPFTVHFFHRTMYDFLKTKEMKEYLASKLSNDFNIHIWLMKGRLIRRKRYPVELYRSDSAFIELHSELVVEVADMLLHAADAFTVIEKKDFKIVFTLLDEYERALHDLGLQAIASAPSGKHDMLLVVRCAGRGLYLDLASYFREMVVFFVCHSLLREYFEAKVLETPGYLNRLSGSLFLQFTALPYRSRLLPWNWQASSRRPSHSMVEWLLRAGANPNEPFIEQTARSYYAQQKMITQGKDSKQELEEILSPFIISPWVFLMRRCVPLDGVSVCGRPLGILPRRDVQQTQTDLQMASLYLNYGADPDAEYWDREPTPLLQCSENCQATKNMEIFGAFYLGACYDDCSGTDSKHLIFAKPPLWSISCFFAYIWSAFQTLLDDELHIDYLATLDTFLSKHPSLDASNHISDDITTLELDNLGWIILNGDSEPSKSPFVQFCTHIYYRDAWTDDPASNQFRSAIIEKLIDYCGTIKAHEKFFTLLEFGISKAETCPEDIKRRLLDLVEENRNRNGSGSGSRDRSGSQDRSGADESEEV